MTQDKIIDRDELQEAYVKSILVGGAGSGGEQFVYDTLNDNMDKYTVDELIEEVDAYYPELLEEVKEK